MRCAGAYIVAAFLATGAALGAARADTLPELRDVTGVAANDVLNIRALPSAASAKIGALTPDATGVEVTAVSENGRWGRVVADGSAGWVAMRFLGAARGPVWSSGRRSLDCSGTEPFWSLDIDPQAGVARYESLGHGEGPMAIRRTMSPLGAGPPALGFVLAPVGGAGQALVSRADCSDGMSERPHALAIELFLSDGRSAEMLRGCCSLAR